ncbi:hypothetical protein TIFTF001_041048, partial [Ficus carica]
MAKNDAIIQNQSALIQSQAASLRTLENQVGQLANVLSNRPQGSLPSDTENPRRDGKEHCKAITLRNGRQIEQPVRQPTKEAEPSSIQSQPSPKSENEADQNATAEQNAIAKSQQIAAEFAKTCSPKMINEDNLAVSDKDEEASDNQVSWMESKPTA